MINYKVKHNLTGSENWPNFSTVFVEGNPEAQDVSSAESSEEKERIIQSWDNIAVLKATAEKPTDFYFGFYNQAVISYLKHEFTTDLEFGVRIGSEDINFFVIPKEWGSPMELELVEKTKEDDPKYEDLIVV